MTDKQMGFYKMTHDFLAFVDEITDEEYLELETKLSEIKERYIERLAEQGRYLK